MKTITFDESKWKLVPLESTMEMDRAGGNALVEGNSTNWQAEQVYKAMLAAAPTPPETADSDRRDAERYRWLRASPLGRHALNGAVPWAVVVDVANGKPPEMRACFEEELDQAIDAAMGARSES